MDTNLLNNGLLASLLSGTQTGANAGAGNNGAQKQTPPPPPSVAATDKVEVSNNASAAVQAGRTRLVAESITPLDNGFRKTQEFEQADGRTFTRTEEVVNQVGVNGVLGERTSRLVTQENASGSVTSLEDVFDRQEDGSFRLTQRFTNELGETSVNIDPDATPPNADIILGRAPRTDTPPAYAPSRGLEIDLVT